MGKILLAIVFFFAGFFGIVREKTCLCQRPQRSKLPSEISRSLEDVRAKGTRSVENTFARQVFHYLLPTFVQESKLFCRFC